MTDPISVVAVIASASMAALAHYLVGLFTAAGKNENKNVLEITGPSGAKIIINSDEKLTAERITEIMSKIDGSNRVRDKHDALDRNTDYIACYDCGGSGRYAPTMAPGEMGASHPMRSCRRCRGTGRILR